jgi:hypothetical protein
MRRQRTTQPPAPPPDIEALVIAEKTFGSDPIWHIDGQQPDKYVLSVPLNIGYVICEGLFLDGNCQRTIPDASVSLSLTYKPAYGPSGPLTRLDWKPTHLHHNNGLIRGEWRFKRIDQTHLHPFAENYIRGLKWMFENNLPIALPVERDLRLFREMLDYLGGILRIGDIQRIAPPAWEPRLL